MPDFKVRSDAVNVEQIMNQVRARIREKRGVDYTEADIQELAAVKLERFLDPRGIRSDLLEHFRRTPPPPERPNYVFGENTLFETHRGAVQWIRKLLRPILKLFFNPNPLIQALHIQSQLNTASAEREASRHALDQLHYELMHNLVLETTRLGVEVKNLKMRVESVGGRLEFNERRARALESVVVYKSTEEREDAASKERAVSPPIPAPARPSMSSGYGAAASAGPSRSAPSPSPGSSAGSTSNPATSPGQGGEGPGQRSRRRRRRRGRRSGGSATSVMGPSTGVMGPSTGSGPRDASRTIEEAVAPPAQPSEPRMDDSRGAASGPSPDSAREPSAGFEQGGPEPDEQ